MKNILASLTEGILAASDKAEELEAGLALEAFIHDVFVDIENEIKQSTDETTTAGGIALSPKGAAECLKEYYRTVRFIKGIYRAISKALEKFQEEEVHILYAGCGPFAAIVLPVLPLFPQDRLRVTLLDIHPFSIKSATSIFEKLDLKDYLHDTIVGDACSYSIKKDQKVHILVSETMFRGLIREPQYKISTNLAPQLKDGGILIPEEIIVEAGYSFFANEPYYQYNNTLNTAKGIGVNLPPRKIIGTVLQLNKNTLANGDGQIKSTLFRAPATPLPEQPDLCLFTTVRIYGDIILHSTESTITNPHIISALANRYDNRQFRLQYTYNDIPGWEMLLEN